MSTTMTRRLATIVVFVNWIFFSVHVLSYVIFFVGFFILFDVVVKVMSDKNQGEHNGNEELENSGGSTQIEQSDTSTLLIIVGLIIIGVIGLIILLFQMALNILLTRGVTQSDRRRCNIWLIIQLIFFVLAVIGLIGVIFRVTVGFSDYSLLIADIIGVIWLGLSLIVIKKLRDECVAGSSKIGVVLSKAGINSTEQ